MNATKVPIPALKMAHNGLWEWLLTMRQAAHFDVRADTLAVYPNISVTLAVPGKRPNQASIAVIFDVLFQPLFGESTFGHSSKILKKEPGGGDWRTAATGERQTPADQSMETGRALLPPRGIRPGAK